MTLELLIHVFLKSCHIYHTQILVSGVNMCMLTCTFTSTYCINKNVSKVHRCPTHTIIFHVQWTMKLGKKSNLALKLDRSYHREYVYYFFLVSSWLDFNFFKNYLDQKLQPEAGQTNWRTDKRTNEQTDRRMHRPENIMPLYYHRWGLKKWFLAI